MFGHKSNNQTTVGAPTVQNPSMLDNVSSQDFDESGDDTSNVQQQVEEALNKHEMKKVMDAATAETPVVKESPFMSSPSATPTASVAASGDDKPADDAASAPLPVPDDTSVSSEPEPAADTPAPAAEPPQDDPVPQSSTDDASLPADEPATDAEIPRPLSPAENSEIESHPTVSAVSTSASDDSADDAAESPSAPIAPPPAPADSTPELPKVQSPAEDTSTDSEPEPKEAEEPAEKTEDTDAESQDASVDEPAKDDDGPEPEASEDESSSEADTEEPAEESSQESEEKPSDANASTVPEVDKDKLAGMKQQALDHLEPLVDHLDQSPEEEFKTTMMRIQANDNHTLLERALKSAKSITDDKQRAQAMLDIINEINYFSQNNSDE